MGKSEPRRGVAVGLEEEDSEDDNKPLGQAHHHRQSLDGGGAADRAPKRQRTASDDGGRRARGAAAAEHNAAQQQAEPATAAAADAMEVDEPEQQQDEQLAAAQEQPNSTEADTPFAVMEDAFPGLQHSQSAAADADEAAPAAADAPPAALAAAGSARQRHSGKQSKAVQQQQLPERMPSRSLSGRSSHKLGMRMPPKPQQKTERSEKARLPWEGADTNWGKGCTGVRFKSPSGAGPVTPPPVREAAVGWGFWLFYEDEPAEDEPAEDDEQQEGQEQQQAKGPMPGVWWRGMVWWFSAKEANYKFVMEDGEYVPNVALGDMAGYLEKGEIFFCKPPRGWPPQHCLAEQQSGLSSDVHEQQQQQQQEERGQELKQEAAAAGKRTKQHTPKKDRRKPQQQQPQQADEETAVAVADAADAAPGAEPTGAAAEGLGEEQQAKPAKQQQQQPQKQPKQHQAQLQQRPPSAQQQVKPQQQHGPASQAHKQRKRSAGTAGASRPARAKPHPPPSPAAAAAEAAAAAAAATAAAAGLSPPASAAAAGGGGAQRPRSALARQQQQQQQQQQQELPDLSGMSGDAARLASCLLKLREGSEAVTKGLALQREAFQELSTGVDPDRICELAGEVKRVLNSQQAYLGGQLLRNVKLLAEAQPQSWQEVDSSAQQLYQQLKQGRKPPGTPSKAPAGVKQEGEAAAAAAAAGGVSLRDLEAAAAAGVGLGGLGKRSREASIKQESAPAAAAAAAAAAEQQSPHEQQVDGDDAAAAAGGDAAEKDTFDMSYIQSLVPVRCLDDPLRDKAVALLSAVLQPPAAASPFALAHELEAKLHDQHGMIGPGKHMYLRHLYMIWCVLGGRELTAAAEAAQRARDAAAEAAAAEGGPSAATAAAAAAAAAAAEKAAAAAARAELEGVPGVADAAAVRTALLEGAAGVEDLFDMTRAQLGFDQQRDK